MRKNRLNMPPKYNDDYYKDNILFGDTKITSPTESTKDIDSWTTDKIPDKYEGSSNDDAKRKEPFSKKLKYFRIDNRGAILLFFLWTVLLAGIWRLFVLHYSQETAIAVINTDIKYIKDDLNQLLIWWKISGSDYNNLLNDIIEIKDDVSEWDKKLALIENEIEHIKEKIKKY